MKSLIFLYLLKDPAKFLSRTLACDADQVLMFAAINMISEGSIRDFSGLNRVVPSLHTKSGTMPLGHHTFSEGRPLCVLVLVLLPGFC